MPTFIFNKLVRDKIPKKMLGEDAVVEYYSPEGDALLVALKSKIMEEASEIVNSKTTEDFKYELADLLDVLDAVSYHLNISYDEIEKLRTQKQIENGGFVQAYYVQKVYLNENDSKLKPWIEKLRLEPDRYKECKG